MPLSTVGAVLSRHGLGRLPRLAPEEPANRYERPRPGELVHIDVKKLGKIGRPGHRVNGDRRTQTRGIGWEFVHVAVDDATRLAYVEVLDDEKAATAASFLRRAIAFFRRYGIQVERVLTDHGACYRAIVHALARDAQRLPDLLARARLPAGEAEPQLDRLPLALGQGGGRRLDVRAAERQRGHLVRRLRILGLDEVAELRVLLLADRLLEGD